MNLRLFDQTLRRIVRSNDERIYISWFFLSFCFRGQLLKDTCNRIEENNPIYRGYLQTTLNEGCGVTKDQLYLKMYQDLRRRGRLLHSFRMCQGPDDAFLDYFPPGFVPGKSKPIVVIDKQHACLRPVSPERLDEKWKKKSQELHNMELKLHDNHMIMGPHEAFPEFFPPNFDHQARKRFPKLIPTCRGQCGGDRVPGPFLLTPKCRFLTHIPLSYVPQYKKQHHVWPTYCFNQSLRR